MGKFSYARLSASYLLGLLQSSYEGLEASTCSYFTSGLHDNYLLKTDSACFICRVYRSDWRSENEIGFELEYLAHLVAHNCPVSAPILSRAGSLFINEGGVESCRFIALFSYAAGLPPQGDFNLITAGALGSAVASIHQSSMGFQSVYQRKALALPFLLSESLIAIQPYLKTPKDADYLLRVAKTVEQKLQPIEASLPQVICHGDINPSNFHIAPDQQITLFDFDQCGVGARIFEIAKFQASIRRLANNHSILEAFIDSYQQTVPPLTQKEWEVLPYYEAVAVIWVMAIRPLNAEWIGCQLLQDDFWQQRLAILRGMPILNE